MILQDADLLAGVGGTVENGIFGDTEIDSPLAPFEGKTEPSSDDNDDKELVVDEEITGEEVAGLLKDAQKPAEQQINNNPEDENGSKVDAPLGDLDEG